jgi:hypothetical protein
MKINFLKRYRWRLAAVSVTLVTAITILWPAGVLPRLFKTESGAIELSIAPGYPGSVSWAGSFDDFRELCNLSDLVVIGIADRYIELAPASRNHNKEPEFYNVTTAFKVNMTLKGPVLKEVGLTHSIRKLPEGWVEFMAENLPPRPGERWAFFLRWIEEAGHYVELGPWGRYKIIDGRVYSMNRVLKDNNSYGAGLLDFDGISLSGFVDQVNDTLNSTVMVLAQHGLPFRGYRNHAGVYQDVDIAVWTGAEVTGDMTFNVSMTDSAGFAVYEALIFTLEPATFRVVPLHQYISTMRFGTGTGLAPGVYTVSVSYMVGKYTGSHTFTLWIEPVPETEPYW